ncbi:BspA family leucine-rich repeat surface protein, partial [Companilactobacillus crustorum]
MFQDLYYLTEIDGLKNINTSKVTNMSSMFFRAKSLTNLDLSSFDTRKVTDMSGMFCETSKLTNLNLSS